MPSTHETPTSERADDALDALRAAASNAAGMAYVPYSGASVQAAVLTTKNAIFAGANIEVLTLNLSKHAEEVAILRALAEDPRPDNSESRKIISTIYTTAFPCGSCRQFLLEFATADCVVYMQDGDRVVTERLKELLPRAYTPETYHGLRG